MTPTTPLPPGDESLLELAERGAFGPTQEATLDIHFDPVPLWRREPVPSAGMFAGAGNRLAPCVEWVGLYVYHAGTWRYVAKVQRLRFRSPDPPRIQVTHMDAPVDEYIDGQRDPTIAEILLEGAAPEWLAECPMHSGATPTAGLAVTVRHLSLGQAVRWYDAPAFLAQDGAGGLIATLAGPVSIAPAPQFHYTRKDSTE